MYLVKKCFDLLRPYLSELTSESNTDFNSKSHNYQTSHTWNEAISQRYRDSSKQSKQIEAGLKDTSTRVGEKKKSVFQIFSKNNGSSKSKDNEDEPSEALR